MKDQIERILTEQRSIADHMMEEYHDCLKYNSNPKDDKYFEAQIQKFRIQRKELQDCINWINQQ